MGLINLLNFSFQQCVNVFSSLDERMSRCGGRALDVGEKLGAARAPRARAAAARDLLSHLAQFLSPGPVLTDMFSDPNKVYLNLYFMTLLCLLPVRSSSQQKSSVSY